MPKDNNMTRLALAGSLLLSVAACSQPAPSPLVEGMWTVDGGTSSLSFVTVKNGDVGEAHGFGKLGGSVEPDGTATLTIDLASVDTGVEIRDQRMRDVLFEVNKFATATVTAKLDKAVIKGLKTGASTTLPLALTLNLHGQGKSIPATVTVTALAGDRLLVTTREPLIINATDFDLVNGIEQLRELAGLPSIDIAVPVTATLVFSK